jgi:D-hexose-6-phosphate mutarotase
LTITSETDRVYTPPTAEDGSAIPITVSEDGKPKLRITRDALPNVTIWNPWEEKAASMGECLLCLVSSDVLRFSRSFLWWRPLHFIVSFNLNNLRQHY